MNHWQIPLGNSINSCCVFFINIKSIGLYSCVRVAQVLPLKHERHFDAWKNMHGLLCSLSQCQIPEQNWTLHTWRKPCSTPCLSMAWLDTVPGNLKAVFPPLASCSCSQPMWNTSVCLQSQKQITPTWTLLWTMLPSRHKHDFDLPIELP